VSSDHEITTTRLINAPRERVFKAWTDPDQMVHLWGANKNKGVFVEILEPERVIFQHVSPPRFKVVVTFEDRGQQTELTWITTFDSAAECAKVRKLAVAANEQHLDRLEQELALS